MTHWESDVREQVRLITGEWADEVAAAWSAFAERPLVQVTLHGGYDTGKTSLLKRFLVEDGTPVPEWLEVGGRPTSYEVRRVASDGLDWVDTPGTDSGNDDHDALAAEALTLTDAVLVLLSPQMLSGAQHLVRGLIDGSFYNPVATTPFFAPGSLIVAVAQMDTGGASPWDDLAGYQRLVELKRGELLEALGTSAAILEEHLHFVAADPDEAGRSADPDPREYTGNEAWDGVADLRADLRALAARRTPLRAAASVRYWSWIAVHARVLAEAEDARLDKVLDEARRHDDAIKLVFEQLDALDRNARHKLKEAIYDELLSGLALTDDGGGRSAAIERRLNAAIGVWLAEWAGKLDGLARRAALELQVRAERPGAAVLQDYLDDLLASEPPSATSSRPSVDQLLKRLDGHAKTVARAGYTLLAGMSAEEARAELTHLRFLEADQVAKHFANGSGLLTSKEQAAKVEKSLGRLEAVETVLPIAIELTGFVAGAVMDYRAARQGAELRAQLRRRADELANEIADRGDGTRTWSDAVAGLREQLLAVLSPREVIITAEERRSVVGDAAKRLTDLLGQAPAPAAAAGPTERLAGA